MKTEVEEIERELMTGDMQNALEQTGGVESTPSEQTMESTIKILQMQHKANSRLVAIHLQQLTKVIMSSHGVSEKEKRQANAALVEALLFALDFGVGVTKASIRDGGTPYANETNNLAAVLVKALDNRMVLLADNMRKQEELEAIGNLDYDDLVGDVETEVSVSETNVSEEASV